MRLIVDLKEKEKTVHSKYHDIREHLETTYELIQGKVFSKFHEKNYIPQLTTKMDDSELRLFASKFSSLLPKQTAKDFFECFERRLNIYKKSLAAINDNINWSRGRFKGELKKITLKDRIIIEKTFSTPKGSTIVVKRSELGLFSFSKFLGLIPC